MSRRVALSAKRVSTTSLSIPKWDDTRVSPFASLPFYPARARLKESPLPLLHRLHLLYLPALTLFPHRHRNRRASGRGRSVHRRSPPPRIATTTETERLPFVRARETRPPVAKCICRRNRPSVRHACSLLRFPPAATKRLGSPSLLCPTFLCSPPLSSVSSHRAIKGLRRRRHLTVPAIKIGHRFSRAARPCEFNALSG